MFTTTERRDALVRTRKRRMYLIHHKPHWFKAIRDTAVLIDALESLITLDLTGGKDATEKKKQKD